MINCLFCKIINKDIPATIVYEDEEILAFHDIHPVAPVHILLIPKRHIINTLELQENDKILMGHMMFIANKIALQMNLSAGYKMQINTGKSGGQEVFHLHLHVFGKPE